MGITGPSIPTLYPARIVNPPEGGNESGICIVGPPHVLLGYLIVVEALSVTLHLNHRHIAIPGSEATITAAEAGEANPKRFLLATPFVFPSDGELVMIAKTNGGQTFVNIQPIGT